MQTLVKIETCPEIEGLDSIVEIMNNKVLVYWVFIIFTGAQIWDNVLYMAVIIDAVVCKWASSMFSF